MYYWIRRVVMHDQALWPADGGRAISTPLLLRCRSHKLHRRRPARRARSRPADPLQQPASAAPANPEPGRCHATLAASPLPSRCAPPPIPPPSCRWGFGVLLSLSLSLSHSLPPSPFLSISLPLPLSHPLSRRYAGCGRNVVNRHKLLFITV